MATAGGGGGGGRSRVLSCRERENNKIRERRRRAITAKIFSGLRTHGNYTLPKHCDNNEVLRALCSQAGWNVEPDGTTYPEGCKHGEHMSAVGGSAALSPCLSYNLSPFASYHPSHGSSSLHSPASSSYAANACVDRNSLIPWFSKISSASSSASSSSFQLQHFYMLNGSINTPVTSALTSIADIPRLTETGYNTPHNSLLQSSTPLNTACQIFPNPEWNKGLQIPESSPGSPTLSLAPPNSSFCFKEVAQALPARPDQNADGSNDEVMIIDEFAFRSSIKKQMNPWEGERIHDESVSDDLKLTLGTPWSKYDK